MHVVHAYFGRVPADDDGVDGRDGNGSAFIKGDGFWWNGRREMQALWKLERSGVCIIWLA